MLCVAHFDGNTERDIPLKGSEKPQSNDQVRIYFASESSLNQLRGLYITQQQNCSKCPTPFLRDLQA